MHSSRILIVSNLTFSTTADALAAAFEGFDVEVHVATDQETGKSRGFAVVLLAEEHGCDAAIKKVDGAAVDGRSVQVCDALGSPTFAMWRSRSPEECPQTIREVLEALRQG